MHPYVFVLARVMDRDSFRVTTCAFWHPADTADEATTRLRSLDAGNSLLLEFLLSIEVLSPAHYLACLEGIGQCEGHITRRDDALRIVSVVGDVYATMVSAALPICDDVRERFRSPRCEALEPLLMPHARYEHIHQAAAQAGQPAPPPEPAPQPPVGIRQAIPQFIIGMSLLLIGVLSVVRLIQN